MPNIEEKWFPLGLRGSENRSKIAPGSVPGQPEASKDDPERPRRGPGSSQNVPGATVERPKMSTEKKKRFFGCPRTSGSAPEQLKSTLTRLREPKNQEFFSQKTLFLYAVAARTRSTTILYRFLSVLAFFVKRANPLKYCACQPK